MARIALELKVRFSLSIGKFRLLTNFDVGVVNQVLWYHSAVYFYVPWILFAAELMFVHGGRTEPFN